MSINKYYTIEEISKALRLGKRTLYGYIKEGKIEAVKLGKEWRISEEALFNFLNENLEKSTHS